MKPDLVYGENTEMYIKTLYEMTGGRQRAPVTDLADQLGISTVSASEKVRRLQEQGFVQHLPYKGVKLTEAGRNRANAVLRRHRLWECFLVDHLQVEWEQAHEAACRLEHATDQMVGERLARFLQAPQTCPHGNPIPALDAASPPEPGVKLTDLDAPVQVVVMRVFPEDTPLLSELAALGLKPGTACELRSFPADGGPLELKVAGRTVTLPAEPAGRLFVSVTDEVTN